MHVCTRTPRFVCILTYDEVPCLLKRQRLPKNWEAARRGAAPEYVSFRDLCCGETIHVYGREMLLIDCDQFTKDFFRYLLWRHDALSCCFDHRPPARLPARPPARCQTRPRPRGQSA